MLMLGTRFDEALAWAVHLHREQPRKGSHIPYVAHILGVASIALENGADEDQAIAALLHDAIEDQDVTAAEVESRFGPRVAGMVADCTDAWENPKPKWRPRKEAYLDSLGGKDRDSLLVSVSDKTHNARAIVDDLAVVGAAVWERFTGGKVGTLWYYAALAERFEALLPGAPTRRFRAAVSQMEHLAQELN